MLKDTMDLEYEFEKALYEDMENGEPRPMSPLDECRRMWESDDPEGCKPAELPVHMCSQRQGHKGAHVCRDCGAETA